MEMFSTLFNNLLRISGLKIMWSLALGNLALEFLYLSISYLKKQKTNVLKFVQYIIPRLSIVYVINGKAKKLDLYCIISVYSLYLCNNTLIKPNINGFFAPFFNGHFNDTIATIMLLAYFNISYAAKSPEKRIVKLHIILVICFIWAVLWENFAPIFNPIAVKDPLDVLCYCIGGIIYYVINIIVKNNFKEDII